MRKSLEADVLQPQKTTLLKTEAVIHTISQWKTGKMLSALFDFKCFKKNKIKINNVTNDQRCRIVSL